MATERQIKANRNNAKQSTGPKTPEGKAKSARNATTHGLTASADVIKGESQEEFDAHRQRMITDLDPRDSIEYFLADHIASLAWRLKRAGRIQNQLLNGMLLDMPFIVKDRAALYEEPSNHDPNLVLGAAINRDFSRDKVVDRLMLYERRIQTGFLKCLNTLQKQKRQNTPAADQSQIHSAHLPINASTHPHANYDAEAIDIALLHGANPADLLPPDHPLCRGDDLAPNGQSKTCPEPSQGQATSSTRLPIHASTRGACAKRTQFADTKNSVTHAGIKEYSTSRHAGGVDIKPNNPRSDSLTAPNRPDDQPQKPRTIVRRY